MATQVRLQGSRRTLRANSRSAGPVDPREIISLTVRNDVVWNDGTPFDGTVPGRGGWASGGGMSSLLGKL